VSARLNLIAPPAEPDETSGMPVLERDHVLASLSQYADEAAYGEGRLVLVSGEAGAGKSTLLEEFTRTRPDLRWLRGGCDGLSTPRPLGPLFDVAAQLGGDLAAAGAGGASREALFSLLLEQLRAPGTVLVLEDLHWADESTLDLVLFLSRRVRDVPALLVATYRDEALEPEHPLRLVLGDLATERTTRRVSLPPLSQAAVAVLAAGQDLAPSEVYRLTGGNPFLVTEVVQAPRGNIPHSVRDAVLARVGRLSTEARHAVHAAALIGARVEPELLAETTSAGAGVIDELVSCRVLVSDAAHLRFRHELTRLAVEAEVPAHRRRTVHVRVLAALRKAGCDRRRPPRAPRGGGRRRSGRPAIRDPRG
jgi:predicted ATPase